MPTVLMEDNHCLVVNKPAGMLTQSDISGDKSLVDWVADYWKQKYAKTGNVFVGLIHRLDRPTSGVILIARTSKAAARLSEQFRLGQVEKTYLAVCEGSSATKHGTWEDHLIKDRTNNLVAIAAENQQGSQVARVQYQVEWQQARQVGMSLKPLTGRGHQLRVQLASRGLPIVGDRKYGAQSRLIAHDGLARVALHAARLQFKHPTKGELCVVQAPLPSDWPAAGLAFEKERTHSSRREELPDR